MGAVIGISGYSGSGKDYVADAIIEDFPEYKFKKVYFADELKKVAASMLELPLAMMYTQQGKQYKIDWLDDMTVREFLQKLGTDAVRNNVHNDFWPRKLMKTIGVDDNVVIPDMRFPNEFEAVKQAGFCARVSRYATVDCWNRLSGLSVDPDPLHEEKRIAKTTYMANALYKSADDEKKWKAMVHISETALDGYEFEFEYDLCSGEKPVHRERLSKYIFENGYVKF